MSDDEKIIPIRTAEILISVGGMVDETRATLAIHGESLDPELVSRDLRQQPSETHRKGERRGSRGRPFEEGAWFLTVEVRAPEGPDEALRRLLMRFPGEARFWADLREAYGVQIRVGMHTDGWNRGFALQPRTLQMLATTGAELLFDIYLYGEGDS